MIESVFNALNAINVNDKTEKKANLTYLSWAWAWAEVKKRYPDAQYQIIEFDGKPYLEDANLGYMVVTEVTIAEQSHRMWLPVMDFKNKAMPVGQASMFDVNKALMRCLTKNLAMFGLGLYIYAGEDLPDDGVEPIGKQGTEQLGDLMKTLGKDDGSKIKNCYLELLKAFRVNHSDQIPSDQLRAAVRYIEQWGGW